MRAFILTLFSLFFLSCQTEKEENGTFFNADKTIQVNFALGANNNPVYQVYYNNQIVLDSSDLGIIMEDADFSTNLEIISISEAEVSDSYSMLQGKQKEISHEAEKYEVNLKMTTGLKWISSFSFLMTELL